MATVSIGLPVFNGELHLSEALESLRTQSFEDFKLTIMDNASTDRTAEIGQEAAEDDRRIRFVRNSENIGAARNFNRVFRFADSKYFKWAAADDVCAPRFLERALEVLEGDGSVVNIIDPLVMLGVAGMGPHDPALSAVAQEAQAKLERVADYLKT